VAEGSQQTDVRQSLSRRRQPEPVDNNTNLIALRHNRQRLRSTHLMILS